MTFILTFSNFSDCFEWKIISIILFLLLFFKGTTASFIIRKSWASLHLPFDFFIPKIGVLLGLLEGINSLCSFNFSMMGFNPSLASGFRRCCFFCGTKCGSLSLTTTGIAFCARPIDFPSALTLRFTCCSIKGREREGSIFMKTEAWTLFSKLKWSRSLVSNSLRPHGL